MGSGVMGFPGLDASLLWIFGVVMSEQTLARAAINRKRRLPPFARPTRASALTKL